MSLTHQLRKAAYAFPIVFALAANANAAEPRTVELSDLDLSRPLPSNICFENSTLGTAASKFNSALRARNQTSVVIANQVTPNGVAGQVLTSDLKKNEKGTYGEGYHVDMNTAKENVPTRICLSLNQQTLVYSAYSSKGIPKAVNKGELGVALNNNLKSGIRVAYVALTDKGTLLVANFNPNTGEGSLKLSDANGGHAADISLSQAAYSPRLPDDIKRELEMPTAPTLAYAK